MKKINIYVSELGEDFLAKDREEFEKELPISDPVPVEKKEEITQSALNKRLSRIQNSIKTTTDKSNEIIEISEDVEEKIGKKDYSQEYFTMVVTSAGDVTWTGTSSNRLSYSIDNGTTWSTQKYNITLSVNIGDKVLWKGITTPGTSYPNQGIGKFSGNTDVRYSIEGNVMSLLYGDDFKGQTSLDGKNYTFYQLFYNNKNITSAENLSLPATTLSDRCYWYMFYGCTNLVTAPELPATTLANYCYESMFYGCTNLVTAPELPATTLANYCYESMFYGCTNLTIAPSVLPATTLANSCYSSMFYNCTSLTTAPELPATTLVDNCYSEMFSGCTSLTTAPELPATTLANSCYYVMFNNCTSLTTAPELPATTLASSCYSGMFTGCTSLTTAPELPATTLASSCYSGMVTGCTSLTTAPELSATTLANSCYSSMFSGCTNLTTAPELPATTLANSCYHGMFQNCTSLIIAPELPATMLTDSCYGYMFQSCTSLTTAPELPATTLTNDCYSHMFGGCKSLNLIKCLATDISASRCTEWWISGVAVNGTFIKNASMSSWTTGPNGIPSGWTVQDA